MKTKAKCQEATFWQYNGNHVDGKDCSRVNEYGYPLCLIQYLNFHGGEGVTSQSEASNQFGRTVSVSAPQDTWEDAWIKLAYERGSGFSPDKIEKDEDGLWWGTLYLSDRDQLTELFHKCSDETALEFIQRGYVPIATDGDEQLWVKDAEIAKGS
jgi:hypothetical protein